MSDPQEAKEARDSLRSIGRTILMLGGVLASVLGVIPVGSPSWWVMAVGAGLSCFADVLWLFRPRPASMGTPPERAL